MSKWDMGEDKTMGLKVWLDIEVTPELEELGIVRGLIHKIQLFRKKEGYELGDQINYQMVADSNLINVINKHYEEICAKCNIDNIVFIKK